MFYDDLSVYPAFRGVVFAQEEGERIADYLGPENKNLIMQNHGLLTAGGTVAEAAAFFIALERACQTQLLVEASIAPGSVRHSMDEINKSLIDDDTARYTRKIQAVLRLCICSLSLSINFLRKLTLNSCTDLKMVWAMHSTNVIAPRFF